MFRCKYHFYFCLRFALALSSHHLPKIAVRGIGWAMRGQVPQCLFPLQAKHLASFLADAYRLAKLYERHVSRSVTL